MITINHELTLTDLNDTDLNDFYWWIYIDKEQHAKKWNGPYIKEEDMTFEAFKTLYTQDKYLSHNALSCMAIKYNGVFIGIVSAFWKDTSSKWLECGIVIYVKDKWEQGLGSQIFNTWIDHLFSNTDANRIGISTWSGNIRMMRVACKNGMMEEGRIRKARWVNGDYYDAIQMGILREEWLSFNT